MPEQLQLQHQHLNRKSRLNQHRSMKSRLNQQLLPLLKPSPLALPLLQKMCQPATNITNKQTVCFKYPPSSPIETCQQSHHLLAGLLYKTDITYSPMKTYRSSRHGQSIRKISKNYSESNKELIQGSELQIVQLVRNRFCCRFSGLQNRSL